MAVAFLEYFSDCFFTVADSVWTTGAWGMGKADAVRIAACEQPGPRCAADRLCRIELRIAHSFAGQPVDIGSLISQDT